MALKLSYYRYTAIEDSFKKIVVTVVTIATSKIAVTLDNHSKKWYNMLQGDEKNGQTAAQ